MPNRRVFIGLIVFINLLLITSFVVSNVYIENFVKTEINQGQNYNGQGGYVIPYVEDFGFQISVSHPFYENGTIANLGTLPTTIPNYPFYVFCISIFVNLLLIALVLRSIRKVP